MAHTLKQDAFTWSNPQEGSSEASDLGLPPGFDPDNLFLQVGERMYSLDLKQVMRLRNQVVGWKFIGGAEAQFNITIFND